ncbi:FIP (Fungus-Induced Protein) Related [Caenorhabditis elegans]|uniref:FIP (Fungus-Induced Protein) Related n=1 Tax=Caenorhabditis elegans TaxID=6239 RepID=C6KRI6_CAEEL|nr:FIP (Fungus-Induced Protein) Related [Caenorhabditis elegans]CAZ65466.1 FIP (Fungus-Induced Protein) Related [Caenorhabditis elegans]|eukprot:NP_001255347.1 Uncharacterized protein CELE_C09G9.8 [Caenorhabditis elegans]
MNKIIVTFLFIIVIYFTCSEASLFGMKVKMLKSTPVGAANISVE